MQEERSYIVEDSSQVNELVERACGCDVEAFGDLYEIYVRPVYRYVYYRVREHSTAEDITSEVFIKAWKAIGTCNGKGSTFHAWLLRIAHNTLVDTVRKRHREYQYVNNTDPGTLVTGAGSQRLEILDALWRLPPDQREVIMLNFVQDLDNKEIAQVTGKKEGAVRMLKMRALRNLRTQLK